MEQTIKLDQIPAEADRLYIKLYCERKGSNDEDTVQAAKKSWLSLSNSKKRFFYKTTVNRNLIDYAHTLSNSEVYLKKKPKNKSDISTLSENSQELIKSATEKLTTTNTPDELNNEHLLSSVNISSHHSRNDVIEDECREERTSPISEEKPLNQFNGGSSYNDEQTPLVEPTPPTIKVAKDLYNMIRQPSSPDWTDLPEPEKRHYYSAIRTIKRDYVINYMKYLESLSHQQLFNHYKKTFY